MLKNLHNILEHEELVIPFTIIVLSHEYIHPTLLKSHLIWRKKFIQGSILV